MDSDSKTYLARLAAFACVALVSMLIFLKGFFFPPNFFWDENYYLPPAQRYLNRIFFMESHPPLGKILIASGEALTKPNASTTQFIDTDYAKDPPDGFHFVGFRTFPALFAALTALVLFGIFLELSGSALRAASFSALYLFDNALVVHSRGAMLEGIQLFFICAAILAMLRVRSRSSLLLAPLLMGAFFGCALSTKGNAILVAPLLALPLWRLSGLGERVRFIALSGAAAASTIVAVWAYAFSLSDVVNPKLENQGWYEASPELKQQILSQHKTPAGLYYFVRDSLKFAHKYHSKVPQLNYCKPDENGSYPLLWPLGARSINYRWEKLPDGSARYLFLQANPAVWSVALLAILAGGAILGARTLGMRYAPPLRHTDLICVLVGTYVVYLAATLLVPRVFYLYHYFIPLVLCFLLASVLFEELSSRFTGSTIRKNLLAALIPALAAPTFLLYKPLTFYEPITESAFNRLRLLSLWDLIPLGSGKTNPFARPLSPAEQPRDHGGWTVRLSGITSVQISQSWGEPKMGQTVESKPLIVAGTKYESGFGVHADSRIKFATSRKFSRFKALAGLPDEVLGKQTAVIFKVLGDGKELWSSQPLKPGEPAAAVDLDISAVSVLTLEAISPSSSIDHAHACWLAPELISSPAP